MSQPVTLPLDLVVLADSMLSWARHRHNWPADVNADMDMAIRGLRNAARAARPTEPETREADVETAFKLRQGAARIFGLDSALEMLWHEVCPHHQAEWLALAAALRSTQQGTRVTESEVEPVGERIEGWARSQTRGVWSVWVGPEHDASSVPATLILHALVPSSTGAPSDG